MRVSQNHLLALLALTIAGCPAGAVSPSNPTTKDSVVTSDEVLTSALYQLHPENFGINSSMEKPVTLINSWRLKHASQQGTSEDPVPVKAPEGWIAEADVARLAQAKYDLQDVIHIRDSLLFHVIAGYVSDRDRDEVRRVDMIVDYVCRNVALWKDDEIELPLPPVMSLQLGRGSGDDRAWVCTQILRQLRLDVVIIRPKKDVKETSDKWLMGVVIGPNVYVYDMRLGVALKTGAGTSTATLAEIVAHPEWLDQLATEQPYRITSEELADSSMFVVPDSNYWCHRMRIVEQVLPAKEVCVLYDPPMDEDGRTGVLQRVATASKTPVSEIQKWKFPVQQLEIALHQTPEMREESNRLMMPFSLPISIKMTKEGKPEFGPPEWKLQRYRFDQLLGKFAEATKRYLSIRHLVVEPYPLEIERVNRMAAEDAFYWTAICKYELGDYEEAVNQFADYLKTYDRKGKWYFAARSLLAQSRAETGKTAEAIKTLERSLPDDPYRISNALRVKRWSAKDSK